MRRVSGKKCIQNTPHNSALVYLSTGCIHAARVQLDMGAVREDKGLRPRPAMDLFTDSRSDLDAGWRNQRREREAHERQWRTTMRVNLLKIRVGDDMLSRKHCTLLKHRQDREGKITRLVFDAKQSFSNQREWQGDAPDEVEKAANNLLMFTLKLASNQAGEGRSRETP